MKSLKTCLAILVIATTTVIAAPQYNPFFNIISVSTSWRQTVIEKAQKVAAIKVAQFQGTTDPSELKQLKLGSAILQFNSSNALQSTIANVLINYITNATVINDLNDYVNCTSQAETFITDNFLLVAQTVYPD